MRVLRVVVHAPICSFRMPHFLVGRQLTYDMPPPSTVYGHVASALGELPEPSSFRFGYHFTSMAKSDDLEHQHIVTAASAATGKLPGTSTPKTTEGTVQPTRRQFLLDATLTIYLTRIDLAGAFRQPAFPVILGRSQDLADCTAVEEVDLEPAGDAYFESTILPASYRMRGVGRGTTVVMSRYVAPPPWREVTWDKYIVLRDRVATASLLRIEGAPLELWVDPDSPERQGSRRAVVFHSFV